MRSVLLRSIAIATLVLTALGVSCSNKTPPSTFVASGPTVQVVETTGDASQLLQPQPNLTFGTGGSSSGSVITVNDGTTYQPMDGFGASLTDSAAWVVNNNLTSAQQTALWQSLFSPSAGIGISFLRQPMGASDFSSIGNYSYDDMPAGQTDPNLTSFSIAHDTSYIIPLLQSAI